MILVSAVIICFLTCMNCRFTLSSFNHFGDFLLPCLPNLQTNPPGAHLNPALISSWILFRTRFLQQERLEDEWAMVNCPYRVTPNMSYFATWCLWKVLKKTQQLAISLTQTDQGLPLYFGWLWNFQISAAEVSQKWCLKCEHCPTSLWNVIIPKLNRIRAKGNILSPLRFLKRKDIQLGYICSTRWEK